MRRRTTFAAFSIFVGAAGCAQGSFPADVDTSGQPDMGTVTSPRDTGNVTPQDTRTPTCGMCCAEDVLCLDDNNVGICKLDGTGFDAIACPQGQLCVNGMCTAQMTGDMCTPGERDCFDDQTPLICRQTGTGYVSMTCDPGYVCSQGGCTTMTPLGGSCAADTDCATGRCRCKAADGCPAFIDTGLCTDSSCTADSCGMRGRCLSSATAPIGVADFDHCVRVCSDDDPCPAGTACVGVPVHTSDGGVEFADACYFTGVVGLGGACDSAAECILGRCLTGHWSVGYCSRRCDDDGACPSGSACVEQRPGEFWCTEYCGDGSVTGSEPCPLDEPTNMFDVTCKNLSTKDGSVKRVCARS